MSSYLRVADERISKEGRVVVGDQALDSAVRALFALSWGRARDLVSRGKVSVDGQTVTNPVARVRDGAVVVVDLAARSLDRDAKPGLPDAAVVFVDAHVIVVEKPAGVATVPFDPEGMGASIAKRAKPGEALTLDALVRQTLARLERRRGRTGPPPDIGVVHRLDKETSGLVVFTRTWAAKKALMQAFRLHTVHRRYLAIVHGEAESQTIRSHFVPDRGDGIRGSVEKRHGRKHAVGSEKTQLAVTHIEVVERLAGKGAGEPCTLVACRLETGRTHQIRIHLAEAGHPLVGERVYIRNREEEKSKPGLRRAAPAIPSPRMMLHAAELGFVHPATNQEMKWTSPLPADIEEMLAFLR